MSAKIALNAEDLDRRKRIRKLFSVLRFLLIFIFLAIFLFPVYWIAIGAFKSEGEFYHYPPIFWPEHFNWGNFGRAMTTFGGTQALVSSLIVAITNTMLVIAFGVLLAYAMGRFNVGGDNLSFFVLSLLFAPPVIAATPLFIIFKTLGMLDTYPALFLSYILINMPFAVWIMKGFFEDIPHGIENAALLDGYSRFAAFRKYVLPLAVPGIAVTALFVFIFSWNEFLFALIFTRSHTQTLPIALASMTGGHQIPWGEISALSLIAITPGIILTLFFQKYLVRGLTFGAVKG
ncbi:MAG TPA: carbohydrate ABC transporter permease [Rectinema sp.]|jgi:multiple sugar transport system permease protein|nr:carbohydrate ABC transporter permease [Rectinema sp.]HPG97125.1 carbohydrate ABC transporter permease [Rectinema sp.]HQJ23588.1 carbohydrate ABC transporter permease [Rectinema sp.]HRS32481.1 carbohydrate ABC transporter permease [Rectinema sp.]